MREVLAAAERGDWEGMRPRLHPYLRWTLADGRSIRGRTKVLGELAGRGTLMPPATYELRDGQIYRWMEAQ